jgi:hypothetical protein
MFLVRYELRLPVRSVHNFQTFNILQLDNNFEKLPFALFLERAHAHFPFVLPGSALCTLGRKIAMNRSLCFDAPIRPLPYRTTPPSFESIVILCKIDSAANRNRVYKFSFL